MFVNGSLRVETTNDCHWLQVEELKLNEGIAKWGCGGCSIIQNMLSTIRCRLTILECPTYICSDSKERDRIQALCGPINESVAEERAGRCHKTNATINW